MSFLFVSFRRQLEARALYNLVQRGRGGGRGATVGRRRLGLVANGCKWYCLSPPHKVCNTVVIRSNQSNQAFKAITWKGLVSLCLIGLAIIWSQKLASKRGWCHQLLLPSKKKGLVALGSLAKKKLSLHVPAITLQGHTAPARRVAHHLMEFFNDWVLSVWVAGRYCH